MSYFPSQEFTPEEREEVREIEFPSVRMGELLTYVAFIGDDVTFKRHIPAVSESYEDTAEAIARRVLFHNPGEKIDVDVYRPSPDGKTASLIGAFELVKEPESAEPVAHKTRGK